MARWLRQANYDYRSPAAQQLADALHALGVGTLINLVARDRLFAECHRKGIHGLPAPPDNWRSKAREVIVASVEMAVWKFITVRVKDWDPKKASLRTYFVGSCFFEFKEYYLRYCKEAAHRRKEHLAENITSLFDRRNFQESVEGQVLQERVVGDAMHLMGDEQLARIIELLCQGFPRNEVADMLGVSSRTIDRRLEVIREKLTKNGSWRSAEGR
jgi:RNA polymerase sigma factor (sigma-70 family)